MTPHEEIVLFHYVLGVAITQWANVENQLRVLLVSSFDDKRLNRESLAVGFFSLDTFRSKLQLANGIIARKLAPSKTHFEEWKVLAERARALSQLRNKLAHWGIQRYWHRRPGLRVVLVPWLIIKSKSQRKPKKPQPPKGSLHIRDIYRLSMEFTALACALNNFYQRLCGKPEPHPKSAERAGHPPAVDNLMLQIREVVSPPQLSSREKRRLEDEKNAAASLQS